MRAGLNSDYAENQPCGLPATEEQSAPGAVTQFPCGASRLARYVSLDIDRSSPGVTKAVLMLAEVTVQEDPDMECSANNGKTTEGAPFAPITKLRQARMLLIGELRSTQKCEPISLRPASMLLVEIMRIISTQPK